MRKLLLVTNDSDTENSISRVAAELKLEVAHLGSVPEALQFLAANSTDACVTELFLGEDSCVDIVTAAQSQRRPVPVVVLSTTGTIHDAVSVLRAGALDFLASPFDPGALRASIETALSHGNGAVPPSAGRTEAKIIGEHPSICNVRARIDQVSDTDANILIRGETGTGKEVLARMIHSMSPRCASPFVTVNMAAIPEALVESELMGHVKGAFTGAEQSRTGKIMSAQHGTLFLDEIGDMPKELQAKLLRVLQEREVLPVGGSQAIPVDIRVVAATHRNLEEMIKLGSFREDLFYRLDVIPMEIPPLRERGSDIALLAEHFRKEINRRHNRNISGFSNEVIQHFSKFPWPGNVRQLENAVERLVLSTIGDVVTMDDLPRSLLGNAFEMDRDLVDLPQAGVDLRQLLGHLEERLISQALARTGGNRNQAADLLGLNRTTLVEKIKRQKVLS